MALHPQGLGSENDATTAKPVATALRAPPSKRSGVEPLLGSSPCQRTRE